MNQNKIQTEAVKLLVGLVSKGMRQGIYNESEIIMFNGIIKCFVPQQQRLPDRLETIQEENEEEEKKDNKQVMSDKQEESKEESRYEYRKRTGFYKD